MKTASAYAMTTPIHQICVINMNQITDDVPPECLPGKFAEKHLDDCTHTECHFCSGYQCCFGMRDIGCPRLDPELLHKTDHISSVVLAAYKAGFYNPNDIREIREGIKELVMPMKEKVNQKSFSFIFEGVEFTPQDHATDQTSCPHCFTDRHDIKHPERCAGFMGYKEINASLCAACFRCTKCFSKFFYHVNKSWVRKWR